MIDVFISYSMETSEEIARDIAKALRSNGISCWYAGEHKKPGVYAKNIVMALKDCKVFLLIMNQTALQSYHVQTETAIAFARLDNHEKITLVPFRVENCAISIDENITMYYYLALQDIVEGCPPDAERIRELIDKISRILNG